MDPEKAIITKLLSYTDSGNFADMYNHFFYIEFA